MIIIFGEGSPSRSGEHSRLLRKSRCFILLHNESSYFSPKVTLNLYPGVANRESWYGWSMYLPSTENGNTVNASDAEPFITTQWHLRPGNTHPPMTFSVKNNTWQFTYKWGVDYGDFDGSDSEKDYSVNLGNLPKDQWIDVVVHVKWSSNSPDYDANHTHVSWVNDGTIELWVNGVSKLSRTNVPVGFGDSNGEGWPYMKLGIYHYSENAYLASRKVVHYDEFRHGYNCTYAQVAPPNGNTPPTASFTATPASGSAPVAVSFNGTASSDPNGSISAYAWDFGDGTSGTGATVNHTYTAAGTYTARLTVTDNGGATGSTTKTITVSNPSGTASKLTSSSTPATASSNDGNVPANTLDGSLATRWSAQGDGQWIQYDLGATKTVTSVKIAWHQGDTRRSTFDVQISGNGTSWTNLYSGQSNGTSTALQTYDVTDGNGRYVRIVGHGNTVNTWNSITEVEVWGRAAAGRQSFEGREGGESSLQVWPNPSSGRFRVEAGTFWKGATLRVTDALGRSVARQVVDGNTEVNLAGRASGVYLLHLQKGTKRFTQRVIVR